MSRDVFAVVSIVLFIIALSVHEAAHAFVAYRCGDTTAKDQGRLTLNPLAHIDPIGTVLLPFVLSLASGYSFGWARPVPYNPYNLRNRRRDEFLVAVAGPISNLLQAFIGTIVCALVRVFIVSSATFNTPVVVALLILELYVYLNCVLAFFNLIPLPPLDGSKIFTVFLEGEALQRYYELQRYSMAILFAVLFLLPRLIGVDLIDLYLEVTADSLSNLLFSLTGVA